MIHLKNYFDCRILLSGKVIVLILFLSLSSVSGQKRQSVISFGGSTKQAPLSSGGNTTIAPVSSLNVQEYPYNAVAKIIATFSKCNKPAQGSGAFISGGILFTAAHVVYRPECGGMATEVVIIRGYDKGEDPFGRSKATRIEVPPQYTSNENPNYDFAVLVTKDDGKTYFGFGTPSGDLGDIMILGYPLEDGKYDGETMVKSSGAASLINVNELSYPVDTYGGMSGGPILQKNGVINGVQHYRVIGVHTRGREENQFPVNFGAGFLDAFLEKF